MKTKQMTFNGVTVPKDKKFKIVNPLIIIAFVIMMVYAISLIVLLSWGLLTSLKCTLDFERGNVLGFPDIAYFNAMQQGKYVLNQNGAWVFTNGTYYSYAYEDLLFANYSRTMQNFNMLAGGPQYSYTSIWGDIESVSHRLTFVNYIINSIVYAGGGSLVYALTTMTVGFLCSKYRYKFSTVVYTTIVVIMTIPIVGSQPSTISMLKTLGLYDNYAGMIFQKINFTGMYFLVFYAYYAGISDTYIEAAEIDGASQLRTYINIMVPLAAKMFGTIFLLSFIDLWNDYQTPLLFFPSLPTIAYGVFDMVGDTGMASENRTMEAQGAPQYIAGCMILAIPLVILFIIMSDKIMGNVSMGGLKE